MNKTSADAKRLGMHKLAARREKIERAIQANTPADQGIKAARNDAKPHPYYADTAMRGADLAGALEGEQIADLIDFVRQVAYETDLAGGTIHERVGDAEGQIKILRDRALKLHAEIIERWRNQ